MIDRKYSGYYILIIILFFIYYIFYDNIINSISYSTPGIVIKKSNITNGGRGVFSTRSYNIGDLIEICPCIKQETKYNVGTIEKYTYYYNNKYCIVAFGFCSMYNHKNNPNAKWTIIGKDQMKIVALKNIQPGEEIFISYGSDYFKDLGITMK